MVRASRSSEPWFASAWSAGFWGQSVAGIKLDGVRGERAVVVDDLRRIVDLVLLRVAIFLVAAVVLAPLAAHAYARVWPARSEPVSEADGRLSSRP